MQQLAWQSCGIQLFYWVFLTLKKFFYPTLFPRRVSFLYFCLYQKEKYPDRLHPGFADALGASHSRPKDVPGWAKKKSSDRKSVNQISTVSTSSSELNCERRNCELQRRRVSPLHLLLSPDFLHFPSDFLSSLFLLRIRTNYNSWKMTVMSWNPDLSSRGKSLTFSSFWRWYKEEKHTNTERKMSFSQFARHLRIFIDCVTITDSNIYGTYFLATNCLFVLSFLVFNGFPIWVTCLLIENVDR